MCRGNSTENRSLEKENYCHYEEQSWGGERERERKFNTVPHECCVYSTDDRSFRLWMMGYTSDYTWEWTSIQEDRLKDRPRNVPRIGLSPSLQDGLGD